MDNQDYIIDKNGSWPDQSAALEGYRKIVDSLRKDAARYHFLRNKICGMMEEGGYVKGPRVAFYEYDQVVDTQMEAENKNKHDSKE